METHEPHVRPGRTRRPRLGWAWFAGADARVLALVPSERSFLDAQGLVVATMAVVTGFAVAVAGSGWWNVPLHAHPVARSRLDGRHLHRRPADLQELRDEPRHEPRARRPARRTLRDARARARAADGAVHLPAVDLEATDADERARAEDRAPGRDRLLRAQDQAGRRGDRIDPERRDDAREPGPEVHPPLRLREQRAVVLAHAPLGLRALVSLLRRPGEHGSRSTPARPPAQSSEDRRAQGEDRRLADERGGRDVGPRRTPSATTRTCSPARRR